MTIEFDDGEPVTTGLDYYGTVENAGEYFDTRLRTFPWDNATDEDRIKALCEATRSIDRLAFAGAKTDPDQTRQFPRSGLETIPNPILWATYELALVLLDQLDPELEIRKLGVTSESYAGVRTTYDRSSVDSGTLAGIPSTQAWQYLQPYLADPDEITLSRGS
jgi:hypothetical protein